MSVKLQIFLFLSTVIMFIFMIKLIKKETLQLKYSLLWIIIGVMMIILSIFPCILEYISKVLGIVTPTNTLFLIGLIFELMIVFSLTVALSKSSERVKNLSQEIALIRKEFENNLKK